MLIKSGLDIVIEHEIQDPKGRLTMLKAKIKDKNYYLVNVYGPNKDAEAVRFYQDLSAKLREMEPDSDDNVIIGGDFNCPLNPSLDKKGGILIPRQHVINSIGNIHSRVSEELSTACEGEITFQECENILGSFQAGKTPGNDGIPIEFYKTFGHC